MSTIREDREAIAEAFQRIDGRLNVYKNWPDQFEHPAAVIGLVRRILNTLDGGVERHYDVMLLYIASDAEYVQDEIDKYLEEEGEFSVNAYFNENPTLDGVVDNAVYTGFRDYAGRRTEGATYISVMCEIVVYA